MYGTTCLLPATVLLVYKDSDYGDNIKFTRESVDSLCRDDVDTPMLPYKGKAFTRTMLRI